MIREGMDNADDLLTELQIEGMDLGLATDVVASELRSLQEQQIQADHDRLIAEAI